MKVSGRVAVLSTKMQQEFYNEIAERYNDYVEYLKQVGEYDLEVEAMNLETETINTTMIKMGKGGDSAFGEDSILETVKANVLKKPFTVNELDNLLKESLEGKEAKVIQSELIQSYQTEMQKRLEAEQQETQSKYVELVNDVPYEKKLLKLKEKEGEQAYQQAIQARIKELKEAEQNQIAQTEKTFSNRAIYLERLFKFFYIGRKLFYPVESYNEGQELILAAFIGFAIDQKKKNPFAPSAIKLRFAIASSNKYIAIPASYSDDITSIIGASNDAGQTSKNELLKEWETAISQNVTDRKIRHIITGNLLQAFSDFKGKLVSYTTMNGETKKGILMPDNWEPPQRGEEKITVPIGKAMNIVKALTLNQALFTNNGLSIFKTGDGYKLIVAKSKAKGGDFYLDKDLLELVEKKLFETVADKMVAILPQKNIDKLVEVLQVKHNVSITIPSYQLKLIEGDRIETSNRKAIELPPVTNDNYDNIRILELEAEALALELELLAA